MTTNAKRIMIQGTMSNVGKTLLVTLLCRVFRQDGYQACPFKAQNMTTNVLTMPDGTQMNKAILMQAEAAGTDADVRMNPVCLVPRSDTGSEVWLLGQYAEELQSASFLEYRERVRPAILEAYHTLEETCDIMVIEGAGSPAELNLKDKDIVNMGFAKEVDAPVLLVGDINPGGIFAQLYGTMALLEGEERNRIRGLIVNQFRGDIRLFREGIHILEEKCERPVLGVVPFLDVTLEGEDSLADARHRVSAGDRKNKVIETVVKKPKLAGAVDEEVEETGAVDDRKEDDAETIHTWEFFIQGRQERERQYDRLAEALRRALDMDAIYDIMGIGR